MIPIVAVATGVLLALMGSGLDMARAYMAQSRLQQACDAGVLAGRNAAAGTNITNHTKKIASAYFHANYADNWLGTGKPNITLSSLDNGDLSGTANVTLPTTIMAIFGKQELPISASCTAALTLNNFDFTMVLDYSFSMGNKTSDGVTRIAALDKAVRNFYDTISNMNKGKPNCVRYAFVPFAGNVNVGKLLYDKNPQWIIGGKKGETWTYSTRRPTYKRGKFDRWEYGMIDIQVDDYVNTIDSRYKGAGIKRPTDNQHFQFGKPQVRDTWAGCIQERDSSGAGRSFAYDPAKGLYSPQTREKLYDMDIDMVPNVNDNRTRWRPLWPEIGFFSNVRGKGEFITTPAIARFYSQSDNVKNDYGPTKTVNYKYYDPNNDNENDDQYNKKVVIYTSCPPPARNLSEISKAELDKYLDSMFMQWGTQHDNAVIWGARLASPTGIFKDVVTETPPNDGAVERHMIFMTDGLSSPLDAMQTSYGVNIKTRRYFDYQKKAVVPRPQPVHPTIVAIHDNRFDAVCEAVKAKGIKLWVIAFGLKPTPALRKCASPDALFEAQSAADIDGAFQTIASKAGGLRLAE